MKIALIQSDGRIVELFETENIAKKFNADFIKMLTRVPESAEVGMFFVDKKLIPAKPDGDHILKNGKWVKSDEAEKEEKRQKKYDSALKKIKDVAKGKEVATVQELAKELLVILNHLED